MRVSLLAWSLLSLFSVTSLAAPSDQDVKVDAEEAKVTTFNGIEVPQMKELAPDTFKETIKDGYWSVKPPFTILSLFLSISDNQ